MPMRNKLAVVERLTQSSSAFRYSLYIEGLLNNFESLNFVKYLLQDNDEREINLIYMTDHTRSWPFCT